MRFPLLDWLRGLAAQVIVLHHLAYYGPLSDVARGAAKAPIDWLSEYGRLMVPIFLVSAGYLNAVGLGKRPPDSLPEVLRKVTRRWLRIAATFLPALGFALMASTLASRWMTHDSIPAPASLGQILAHVFLVQDLLGFDSLSAGVWYLAIDLQLVALVAVCYWLACRLAGNARGPALARMSLMLLGISSLFFWNLQPALDRYAIYFFGAYAMGMLVAWAETRVVRRGWLVSYLLAAGLAVAIAPRSRLLVALCVTTLLVFARARARRPSTNPARVSSWLGAISLPLFVVHFPICLLVNAWWSSHLPRTPWLSLLGMVVAWGASLAGAHLLLFGVSATKNRVRAPAETLISRIRSVLPISRTSTAAAQPFERTEA